MSTKLTGWQKIQNELSPNRFEVVPGLGISVVLRDYGARTYPSDQDTTRCQIMFTPIEPAVAGTEAIETGIHRVLAKALFNLLQDLDPKPTLQTESGTIGVVLTKQQLKVASRTDKSEFEFHLENQAKVLAAKYGSLEKLGELLEEAGIKGAKLVVALIGPRIGEIAKTAESPKNAEKPGYVNKRHGWVDQTGGTTSRGGNGKGTSEWVPG
ncbi:MAG: hypothetical protein EB060_01195 [Proteobacteria bacterium]|nr:hypothetical protein [Pseudomonadota bacterium]